MPSARQARRAAVPWRLLRVPRWFSAWWSKKRPLILDAARAAEIGATGLGALGTVPGARVLLNDNPAGVVARLQDIDDLGNIDDAVAELAEDDMAQGLQEAP